MDEQDAENEVAPEQLIPPPDPPESKRPTGRLTLKQRRWLREYLRNGGNGTQASLAVYDTDLPNVAAKIAWQNGRSRNVRAALEFAFRADGLDELEIGAAIGNALRARRRQATEGGTIVDLGPDHRVRLDAVRTWAKLIGADDGPKEPRKTVHEHIHRAVVEPLEVRRWMLEHGRSPSDEERAAIMATPVKQIE